MSPTTVRQEGTLRRTLAGEYLALGLMLHAGFGSIVWGAVVGPTTATLAVVAAGCWVCGRAAGAFAHRLFTPLVSAGLLVAVLAIRQASGELPPRTRGVLAAGIRRHVGVRPLR